MEERIEREASLLGGGLWLLWAGIGLNSTLSSLGYHWSTSQAFFLLFFGIWSYFNVDSYTMLRSFFFNVAEVFFRNFDVAGVARIPEQGAVIFACAPHSNQFVDGIVVLKACQTRDVQFLTAAATCRRKYVGKLTKILKAIPVERPQDVAELGRGLIIADGHEVAGEGTEFTAQVRPGDTLKFSAGGHSAALRVASVQSDTALLLKDVFEHGKTATGSSYKIIPKLNQSKMFTSVHDTLINGGAIGIFPEGGSHDRTSLLPLKAGVSAMALGAMARASGLSVTILPVGINYFKGHRFRSRVFVDIGAPIVPSQEQLDGYVEGGESKREACTELLEQVQEGLKSVTIEAPDFETLQFFRAIRRMYASRHMNASERFSMMQSISEGYTKTQTDEKVQFLYKKVLEYRTLLKQCNVADHRVAAACESRDKTPQGQGKRVRLFSKARTFGIFSYRLFLMVGFLSVSLPGLILASPMLVVTRSIAKHEAKKALLKSSVKVAARDVLATWKVLVSLVMVPAMHLIYTFLVSLLLPRYSVAYFFSAPFFCIPSIVAMERTKKLAISLRPLYVFLWTTEGEPDGMRERLVGMRLALQQEVRALVDSYGWIKLSSD